MNQERALQAITQPPAPGSIGGGSRGQLGAYIVMVRIPELFIISKDIKAFKRRVEWLNARIIERDANAAGSGYDRAERDALCRLLSQIEDKGVSCDASDMLDAHEARKA